MPHAELTRLLANARSGRPEALDGLLPVVYEQFHDWHRRLTEAGIDNLSPIRELGPGTLAFFFSDPNGIVLELMSPPPATGMGYPLLDDPEPAY